jgi:hypothetical protein
MDHAEKLDAGGEQRVIAYYISSEVDEARLLKNFSEFDWFIVTTQVDFAG